MEDSFTKEFDSEFAQTNMFQAIVAKDSRKLLCHIKNGENINAVCKRTKYTYLHLLTKVAFPMTEKQYVPMVYQLSNAGIDLDSIDVLGFNPLQLAIKAALLDLMMAFLKCGATTDPERENEMFSKLLGPCTYELGSWYRKLSPGFWDAVENDKAFKVNILVKCWCRINIYRNGKSVIEQAKQSNACDKIIKMLMNNETTIEFAHATIAGDEDRMRFLLLHHHVDNHTRDMLNREGFFDPYTPMTLYQAATKYGHTHVLPLLASLENGTFRTTPSHTRTPQNAKSAICVIS
ncbi:hypothetical protein KP79_PYT07660 [Mizuhopecten yessoensis]|uniref:Uncharacterized protein n=1 Tax=Mizuhopecten yessoensis TaxID=6573 RepID=A0A210PHP7_MIZYE|nr:hypothetical protein KP79_PYT07660 [Mizuhopecten yessoensis]